MKTTKNGSDWKPTFLKLSAGSLAALMALGLAGCNDSDSDDDTDTEQTASITVSEADASCTALADLEIPASAFGLPTSGASITATTLAADTDTGTPEYCEVTGAIAAEQSTAPDIRFQINLPTTWNMGTVQFGGGAFNGTVVTGLGNVANTPDDTPTPLQRGYVTFGGDSGHATPGGSFGLNDQALANYSGESVKRTHDAAVAIMQAYYDSAPRQTYYIGGSKGGHEALVAAQRYPDDYDGVVSYYPVLSTQAYAISWLPAWRSAYDSTPGGALNATEQALLKDAVLAACDGLDGVEDGLVSNLDVCETTFSVETLRCPGGTDTGDTCLSDAQIHTLDLLATPFDFAFPLANGLSTIGAYPVYNGGDLFPWAFDNGSGTNTLYYRFFDGAIRYWNLRDENADPVSYDYQSQPQRVLELSEMFDVTDPDLDAFRDSGGKLILIHGTTDMLLNHNTTSAYVERLSSRYGESLDDFARYYLVPGLGHGGGDFGARWDSLSALEDWATEGQAPSDPVVYDPDDNRSRPLCEYPSWPRYDGTGDENEAASYSCVTI